MGERRQLGGTSSRTALRLVSSFLSAAALAISVLLAAGTPVSAAGPCAGSGSWFAGWYSGGAAPAHEPEGVKASLLYRDGDGCSAAVGGSKGRGAWVMIQGKNQATRYVQSGYWMFGNAFDCWHHFSEYNNGGGTVAKEGPCTNLNQVHVPLVKYIPNPARTELWIDSLRLDVMNSCVCAFARPLWVDYLGESQDTHSDVPGLSATKGEWSSMQIQYFTDNTWHGTCVTITLFKDVTLARYAADAPACNDTRSWTATP